MPKEIRMIEIKTIKGMKSLLLYHVKKKIEIIEWRILNRLKFEVLLTSKNLSCQISPISNYINNQNCCVQGECLWKYLMLNMP